MDACSTCDSTVTHFSFRCFDCRQTNHLASDRWAEAKPGDIVSVACPNCQMIQGIHKPVSRMLQGHRLIVHAVQPELVGSAFDGQRHPA